MALKDKCVRYYKMDENTGDHVHNTAGDTPVSDDIVFSGALAFGTGKINYGLHCDTKASVLSCASSAAGAFGSYGLSQFSWSAWVKLNSINDASGPYSLFNFPWSSPCLNLWFEYGAGVLSMTCYWPLPSGLAYSANVTSVITSTTTWYHIVGTCKRNSASYLYVNGSQVGTSTCPDQNFSQNGHIHLFNYDANQHTEWNFNGYADELAFFNERLTTDEIATLYAAGAGIQYPFEAAASGPVKLKTYNTIAKAKIKTINTIALAKVKTLDTIA